MVGSAILCNFLRVTLRLPSPGLQILNSRIFLICVEPSLGQILRNKFRNLSVTWCTLQSEGNTDRLDTGVQQVADNQYQQYSVNIQLDDDFLVLVE